jgi:hypothetical protein
MPVEIRNARLVTIDEFEFYRRNEETFAREAMGVESNAFGHVVAEFGRPRADILSLSPNQWPIALRALAVAEELAATIHVAAHQFDQIWEYRGQSTRIVSVGAGNGNYETSGPATESCQVARNLEPSHLAKWLALRREFSVRFPKGPFQCLTT